MLLCERHNTSRMYSGNRNCVCISPDSLSTCDKGFCGTRLVCEVRQIAHSCLTSSLQVFQCCYISVCNIWNAVCTMPRIKIMDEECTLSPVPFPVFHCCMLKAHLSGCNNKLPVCNIHWPIAWGGGYSCNVSSAAVVFKLIVIVAMKTTWHCGRHWCEHRLVVWRRNLSCFGV